MSVFLEGAAIAEAKENTPITRLPTVMTRKEPKVKAPPPPPPPPRPDADASMEAEAGGDTGDEEGAGKYDGMTREQILEKFRLEQAEREAARRKAMDEEVTPPVETEHFGRSERVPWILPGFPCRRSVLNATMRPVLWGRRRERILEARSFTIRASLMRGALLLIVHGFYCSRVCLDLPDIINMTDDETPTCCASPNRVFYVRLIHSLFCFALLLLPSL